MFDTPLRYSRPARSFDGGDVFERLDELNAIELWGDWNIHEDEIKLTIPEDTDLRIGDVIEAEYSRQTYGGTLVSGVVFVGAPTASGKADSQ